MKFFSNFIGAFLLVSSFVVANNSGPSLNAECNFKISTPKDGAGVRFNESCSEIYVLPPRFGKAEVPNLVRTTNLQFCGRVNEVEEISTSTFNSLKVMSARLEAMIKDFDPLDEDLIDARKKSTEARAKFKSAESNLEAAEKELDELRKALKEANKVYQDCLDENSDPKGCDRQKSKADEAKLVFDSFRLGEYRDARKELTRREEDYETLLDTISELQKRYTEGVAPLFELKKVIVELNNEVMVLFKDYANLEGATGQIVWSVRWNKVIDEYKRMNSNLKVTWTRMPLTEALFTSTIKMGNNLDSTLSGLISATIPGGTPSGFSGMGKGQKVEGAALQPSPPTEATIAFGDSISGQIVLSLVGACPYLSTDTASNRIDSETLATHMVANLIYKYEVASHRGYIARYNLSNLLRRIESKAQNGGFFSTESLNAIAEGGDSSEWFDIRFNVNSSRFQYSAEEQATLAVTIKKELIDRAIKQVAVLTAGPAAMGQVPDFMENGANRSASELRKCVHHYCQIGAGILGVANSIWGKSNATAEFHRNNGSWSVDKVQGVQFVPRGGAVTFK